MIIDNKNVDFRQWKPLMLEVYWKVSSLLTVDSSSEVGVRTFRPSLRPRTLLAGLNIGRYLAALGKDMIKVASLSH